LLVERIPARKKNWLSLSETKYICIGGVLTSDSALKHAAESHATLSIGIFDNADSTTATITAMTNGKAWVSHVMVGLRNSQRLPKLTTWIAMKNASGSAHKDGIVTRRQTV